ncbi:hypothetical protein ACIQWA_08810 [Kitasatospora sp. NPDC098652]|uniref:hypothetical protein n=1 Tax=Kitasatospora sp. NPDC098652 TaxID=3364095 RepID=UPI0038041AA6
MRARDAEAVRAVLGAGADPDARGGDGLPALCAAVAGFDHAVAHGAHRPGRAGAVLTVLEWSFRIVTPVDELVARAVRQPDDLHADGAECRYVLAQRPGRPTWEAVTAHRRHPDPRHRRFVASFLATNRTVRSAPFPSFEDEEAELLAAWTTEETDGEQLAEVLQALLMRDHPGGMEGLTLRHADHPAREVRTLVTHCLGVGGQPFPAEVTACLLRLGGSGAGRGRPLARVPARPWGQRDLGLADTGWGRGGVAPPPGFGFPNPGLGCQHNRPGRPGCPGLGA